MWLLRTEDITLQDFKSPEHVPPHEYRDGRYMYAILSHVWGDDERKFEDIPLFKDEPSGTYRKGPSEKIRKACEVAKRGGYEWIWIDSCCINKSSSAELSEAINSMFRYYSLAGECFAYLEDFLQPEYGDGYEDEFKKSKWHTRGWTLQELIAPESVVFYDKDWEWAGDKADIAKELQEATGVPVDVLKDPKQIKKFSIAQRMSWAARRVTTREEDEAYCLLGIFDINMPTLYGEGRKAFRRLQEEIMRQSPDTTLFAWGQPCTWDDLVHLRAKDPASCEDVDYSVFATSPSSFQQCSRIRFVDPIYYLEQNPDTVQHDGYITFTSTPHGVSTEIPTIEYEGQLLGHLGWVEDGRFLLLLLQPLRSKNILSKDKLYKVGGVPLRGAGVFSFPHVVYAPDDVNDTMLRKSARPEWRKVYLAYEDVFATMKSEDTSVLKPPTSGPPSSSYRNLPFHIDPRHLHLPQPLHPTMCTLDRRYSRLPDANWTGNPPAVLRFGACDGHYPCDWFYIHLGVCTRSSSGASPQPEQVVHWAHIEYLSDSPDHGDEPIKEVEHDCSKDHLPSGTHVFRRFGWREYWSGRNHEKVERCFQVTLSFRPFKRYPKRTLELLRISASYVAAFDNDCEIFTDPDHIWLRGGRIPSIEPSSAACIEDTDDSEIEEMEDPNSPSSDTVPAQPSAAVDEPVASSSAGGPHTESSARDHRQAEGMPPGTNINKRGYAEMTGTGWRALMKTRTLRIFSGSGARLPWRNHQK